MGALEHDDRQFSINLTVFTRVFLYIAYVNSM